MAYLTTDNHADFSIRPALRRVADIFAGVTEGYGAYREYQRLNAFSDAQLAGMGLTRHDIPARAFRDRLGN